MAVFNNRFAALLDSDDENEFIAKDTRQASRSLSKASSRSTSPGGSQCSSDMNEYGYATPRDSPAQSNGPSAPNSRVWSLLIDTENLAPLKYVVRNTFVECVELSPLAEQTALSCPALKVGSINADALNNSDDALEAPLWPATPIFTEDITYPHHFCFESIVAPPCFTHLQAMVPRSLADLQESAVLPPPPSIHAESTLKEEQIQQLAQALHERIAELEGNASYPMCSNFQPGSVRETRTNQNSDSQWKTLHDLGLLV